MRANIWLGAALRYGGLGRHPLLRDTASPAVRRMIVSHIAWSRAHNFCYFRIPKAANSTAMRTLAHHCGYDIRNDPGGNAAKGRFKALPTPGSLAGACTFTVVRNPYSRIVSAWRSKTAVPRMVRKYRLHPAGKPQRVYTLLEFLQRLEDDLLMANAHWVPQHELIPLPVESLSHVGKVETLEADLGRIVNDIFGCPLELHTRQSDRQRADDYVRSQLAPAERQLIQRLYARDFELFYPDAG
ncbi:sulfotransferase family protein [Microbulbifer halophilus]|uniref:Sulfotransferase family protein n=1 Tax=Microbulbifer halophilus TaxID=453963 RepID=A0ABW5EFW7_9GAMM|nr:sulfotransferase family protein [Microbulbifer halophilus]MCW8125942.1 sulfotransferase family protein [Microbulbifer halophilus]